MRVAAVVLAAGRSSRLGSPKQMAVLAGETLLARTMRVALDAGLDPVLVVVEAGSEVERSLANDPAGASPRVIVMANDAAAEGMASSIRLGVGALVAREPVAGAVMLACDQPAVTAAHLIQLARSEDEIVASAYAGRKGIPVYFPASAFADLLKLRGDAGAREQLRLARSLPLQDGDLDVDTEEDLQRAVARYQGC